MEHTSFSYKSQRGVLWTVECWKNNDGTYSGYMWHRKSPERITGGWREARTDAMKRITSEAIRIAKDQHGIELVR